MDEKVINLGRVAPTAEGLWEPEKAYRKLSIVTDKDTMVGYIARKDVPAGVLIENMEYWQPFNITGYADSNFVTIRPKNEYGHLIELTLEEAVHIITPVGRKPGLILNFYLKPDSEKLNVKGSFETYQFNCINSTDDDWYNLGNWVNMKASRDANLGWFKTLTDLKKVCPNPTFGQYGYIGDGAIQTQVARCITDGQWEIYDV